MIKCKGQSHSLVQHAHRTAVQQAPGKKMPLFQPLGRRTHALDSYRREADAQQQQHTYHTMHEVLSSVHAVAALQVDARACFKPND
jgi:hypothetical protein